MDTNQIKSVSNRGVRIGQANKLNTFKIVRNYLGHPPSFLSDFGSANTASISPESRSEPIRLPSWPLIRSSQLCTDCCCFLDYLSIYSQLLKLRSAELNYFGKSPPSDLLISVIRRDRPSLQNAVWSGIGPSSYFELKVDTKFVSTVLKDSSFSKD